jgi:hypothetical protein
VVAHGLAVVAHGLAVVAHWAAGISPPPRAGVHARTLV